MKRFVTCVSLGLALSLGIAGLSSPPAVASGGSGGGSQAEVRLRAQLSGMAINGLRPEGNADSRVRGTQRQFKAEAQQVRLADGTVLVVQLNGATVGMIRLLAGRGEMELNSNDGQAVPTVQKGSVVTILTTTGVTVLSGTF